MKDIISFDKSISKINVISPPPFCSTFLDVLLLVLLLVLDFLFVLFKGLLCNERLFLETLLLIVLLFIYYNII